VDKRSVTERRRSDCYFFFAAFFLAAGFFAAFFLAAMLYLLLCYFGPDERDLLWRALVRSTKFGRLVLSSPL
jgi:hypothetical protein